MANKKFENLSETPATKWLRRNSTLESRTALSVKVNRVYTAYCIALSQICKKYIYYLLFILHHAYMYGFQINVHI